MEKLLSICIPTYNRFKFVSKLVSHLLSFDKELFKYVDIFISDNHSSDKTQDFFKKLSKKNIPHLHYHRNNKNIGATKNLEKLILLSKTQYVWWLGDDDWVEEKNIRKTIRCLRTQQCALLLLDRKVVFEDGTSVHSLFKYYMQASLAISVKKLISIVGPLTALGCISNIIFDKTALSNCKAFDYFCAFKTSHPHIGFLLANLADQQCYIDLKNKITTYAFRQTPEEYEHNKDKTKKKQDIVAALAIGLPRMYAFLVDRSLISKNDLARGKEIVWRHQCLILTSVHADFLMSISVLKGTIDKKDYIQYKKVIKKVYSGKIFLSDFLKIFQKIFRVIFKCITRNIATNNCIKSPSHLFLKLFIVKQFLLQKKHGVSK